jgi:hypothetical protein
LISFLKLADINVYICKSINKNNLKGENKRFIFEIEEELNNYDKI